MIDEQSFQRYVPLLKTDQASSHTILKTPSDAESSSFSLALVEMEEPIEAVADDMINEFQANVRNDMDLASLSFVLKTKKLKNVRGIFNIGIDSSIGKK